MAGKGHTWQDPRPIVRVGCDASHKRIYLQGNMCVDVTAGCCYINDALIPWNNVGGDSTYAELTAMSELLYHLLANTAKNVRVEVGTDCDNVLDIITIRQSLTRKMTRQYGNTITTLLDTLSRLEEALAIQNSSIYFVKVSAHTGKKWRDLSDQEKINEYCDAGAKHSRVTLENEIRSGRALTY